MKDNFSSQARLYSRFRPVYPVELYEYILRFVGCKKYAWDCGTGNGQTAFALSEYFEKVYATDISSRQLEHASKADNILYSIEPAEQTSIADDSIDLVTVSQALHWFDFEKFYKEVRRVTKPGSILAAWTYNILQTDPLTEKLIHEFYSGTLEHYWDEERKYVDDGYETIPFPFKTIATPAFTINTRWNLHELEGYLNTWSAVQKFMQINNDNPVSGLIEKIKQHWPQHEVRPVTFPIHLRMAYVQ